MNGFVYFIYVTVLSPLAWFLLQVGGLGGGKKWRALLRAKNSQVFHLNGHSEEDLRNARPFWIHASSGEIEYARPVIRSLKKRFPQIPIVVTYGSPSAVRFLEKMSDVDAWGAVPWEFVSSMQRFVRRFRPRALLVARTDLWPVMSSVADQNGIPSLLFAATFATDSSRLRGLARRLTAWTLSRLTALHAVSSEDLENIAGLIATDKVSVKGDTRFDQVTHRLSHPTPLPEDLRPRSGPVLVAGSTWPEDEEQLIPALAARPDWRMILVPHETNESHLRQIELRLEKAGIDGRRLSSGGPWNERVLIVDRLGILAELYAWGDLAFVGGSFRRQVHSVMEPLASGLRVLVGPHHRNNREALSFQNEFAAGEPAVIAVRDASEITAILEDPTYREGADEIRSLVKARGGSSEAVTEWCAANALTPRT